MLADWMKVLRLCYGCAYGLHCVPAASPLSISFFHAYAYSIISPAPKATATSNNSLSHSNKTVQVQFQAIHKSILCTPSALVLLNACISLNLFILDFVTGLIADRLKAKLIIST